MKIGNIITTQKTASVHRKVLAAEIKALNILKTKQVTRYKVKDTSIVDLHIYNSIKEASIDIGIDQSTITNCIKGRSQTAGDYYWKKTNPEVKRIKRDNNSYNQGFANETNLYEY